MYGKDIFSNKMKKKEKIQTKNWTYFGEVKNNKPHGKGKMKTKIDPYDDSIIEIYDGEFKNGKFHGKGKITEEFEDGLIHIGVWKNGKPVSGKTIEKGGFSYIGEWTTNCWPNGQGLRKWADGTYENGIFKNDVFVEGQVLLKDGSVRVGKWSHNEKKEATIYKYSMFVDKKKKHQIVWYGEFKHGEKKFLYGEGVRIETKKSKPTLFIISIGKFKNGNLEGKGRKIQYKDSKLRKPIWFFNGKFKNDIEYGDGTSIQTPFDHLDKLKMKDGKILDIKTFKLNEEQIKEFYEDYYDQAIDLLSFQKYKYNQLPTKIKKLIN